MVIAVANASVLPEALHNVDLAAPRPWAHLAFNFWHKPEGAVQTMPLRHLRSGLKTTKRPEASPARTVDSARGVMDADVRGLVRVDRRRVEGGPQSQGTVADCDGVRGDAARSARQPRWLLAWGVGWGCPQKGP